MGPIVRGREMVWANSFGEMAKFSKASGKRERRMDTGYGDHLGEITMKAAGKITIKMEKAVSIMQVFLSIEVKSLKDGHGEEDFANRDKYSGDYHEGKPHGYGRYIW